MTDDEKPPKLPEAPADLLPVETTPEPDPVDELPVSDGEREGHVTHLSLLIERVKAQVEANIAAKEARGEPIVPTTADAAKEEHAKLRRLADRGIPLRSARVIVGVVGGDGGGDGPLDLETPAMTIVRAFMAGAPGSLGISGGVGCGKTLAAAWAVAQKVRERYYGAHPDGKDGTWPADYHPRFVDAARLARLPRFAGKGEALAALAPFETCSVLAIDDVGNENDEWFAGILDSLIVARHDNGLRTILTTNMRADAFKAAYKARVADRLNGSGGFFELNEPSRRART